MADVVINSESNDPKELVQLATKADFLRDYNAAVAAYSKAIELIVGEHGDKHDSLGEIYLAYGKTLLEISRDESEPIGDAVPREYSSESDAEEDNKANDAKQKAEEAAKGTDAANEIQKTEENEKTEEEKGKGDNEGEVKVDDGEPTNGSNEEEPTDLQLAWEVLEMAKLIYEKRGATGRRGLSEILVVLGEVSLESENFENGIVDIKAGLEIQKEICKPHDRIIAETYYKLATALSTNNQIDEAIANYNASLEVLNKRLEKLKLDEVMQKDEIKEIENLIPDINEKISDMKSFKEEAAMKLVAAMVSQPTADNTTTSFEAGSSDKKVSDISHLVKRKRKEDEVKADENASKKVSL